MISLFPSKILAGKQWELRVERLHHLGEVKSALNLPAPDGFVISAYAFLKFMDHNGLVEKISESIKDLDIEDLDIIESDKCRNI